MGVNISKKGMTEVGFDVKGSINEHNDKNADIGVNWFS